MEDSPERRKSAIDSGRWWVIPWWKEPQYHAEAGFEASEIDGAFQALIDVFDEAWANEQIDRPILKVKALIAAGTLPGPLKQFAEEQFGKAKCRNDEFRAAQFLIGVPSHRMFGDLFGSRGPIPFKVLLQQGSDLQMLLKGRKLGKLKGRLRHPEQFEAAEWEVIVMARWLEAGVRVEPDWPSGNRGRNCDWKVSDGEDVIYGDVKCLDLCPKNKEAFWGGFEDFAAR